jgi:hypothetical protein
MVRRISQVRADIRREYESRNTAWLEEKRLRLMWRLLGCERILAERGYGLLPLPIIEILKIAGRRDKPSRPERPWRHTYE